MAKLRRVNPQAPALQMSARQANGLRDWLDWIAAELDDRA
jgi:hypothetical protein